LDRLVNRCRIYHSSHGNTMFPRILGFRRVPFVSGRKINFGSEVLQSASQYLLLTSHKQGKYFQ
jgi:hypothetical protein